MYKKFRDRNLDMHRQKNIEDIEPTPKDQRPANKPVKDSQKGRNNPDNAFVRRPS